MNAQPEVEAIDNGSAFLTINEIFFSLQGETTTVGTPTIFIRLTGCPLRCGYCDTEYAFHSGEKKSINDILADIQPYQSKYITVTGGEPLAQKNARQLLTALCDLGYSVSLETSGAMNINHVDQRARIILDIKTPGSGESDKNLITNLNLLKPQDEIKFVLCDHKDYLWANDFISEHKLTNNLIYFSPAYGDLTANELADWILQDQSPVRLQIQLHKLLWGETPGK